MPRYHFIIQMTDHTYDDPNGENLPSHEAARALGRHIVRELKEDGFESAGAVMRVTDEGGQTVLSIPFWAIS